MDNTEQINIRLYVENEDSLYTPFSLEEEFDETVKEYIMSKIAGGYKTKDIKMTVISPEPLDERRFRSAVLNWLNDEKALLSRDKKDTFHLLIGLLIFATVLIILGVALEKKYELVKYSLVPVMDSLALSRAGEIIVLDLPINAAKQRLMEEMEKESIISFEYGYDKNGKR